MIRSWPNPSKPRLLFVAAMIMLGANALIPWLLLERQIVHQQQVERTIAIQEQLNQILGHLVDAETGERGFIITGTDLFLAPYNSALEAIPDNLERLRELMVDGPEQQKQFDDLQRMIKAKLRNLAEMVALRRTAGLEAARDEVVAGRGKRNMDQLRIAINSFQVDQEARQALGTEKAQRAARLATFTFFGIALLNAGLFVAFYRLLNQGHGRRLGTIIGSAMDAFIALDHRQRIVLFNPAAERIFGRSADEMLESTLDPLLPAHHRQAHAALVTAFGNSAVNSRSMSRTGNVTGVRANGEEFPLEASISHSGTGKDRIYTVILRDITSRRKAEADLREAFKQQQELSRRLAEAEENERSNINRELHDRIGQNLAALHINSAMIRSSLPAEAPAIIGSRLDDIDQLLQSTTVEMRNIMAELRPAALDEFGLLAALKVYVATWSGRYGIPVTVTGATPEPRPPRFAESAMFRIAQEALHNTAKHAAARRVDIGLLMQDGALVMSIRDDGRGFDPARLPGQSWGMATMRERAAAANLTLEIESTPGAGTRLRVTTGVLS